MTLFRLLTEGTRALERAGAPDAGLDARRLLLAAFHVDMARFLLNRMQELPEDDYHVSSIKLYRELIARRCRRMPLQQILGSQEFMGLDFYINRHVLIPRQDTETLVELVLEEQCGQGKKHCGVKRGEDGDVQEEKTAARHTLLDLCTGSGCIAVSLAAKGDFTHITATDLSREAIQVARRNAGRLLPADICGNFEFYQGDLFYALPPDGRRYEVIVSNPPYIPTAMIAGLEPEVRDYEPVMALDGSQDGLACYRRIAADAGNYLSDGGSIYLEIGFDQGQAVRGLMENAGFRQVRVRKDLSGNDRVVSAKWYKGN